MRHIPNPLFVLAPTLLVGCQSKNTSGIIQETIALSGSAVYVPESFLGGACKVVAGDVFSFQSFAPEYGFITARFSGDSLITGEYLCPSGQGPGEYLNICSMPQIPGCSLIPVVGMCSVPAQPGTPSYSPSQVTESISSADCLTVRSPMHVNPQAIYTLLIEQDAEGNHADSFATSQYGNIVQRFDWSGTLLSTFSLDRAACAIIVDEADRNLYLQTVDPGTGEIGFVRYRLESLS